MNKFVAFALFLVLISCSTMGRNRVKNTGPAADDVKIYVNRFKEVVKGIPNLDIDGIKIRMADIERPTVGLCWPTRIPPQIKIDRETWSHYSDPSRESLIFHELGHCACFLNHKHMEGDYEKDSPKETAGYLADGCPASIMHPYTLSDSCYEKHRLHYMYEIRVRCFLGY